MRNVMSCEIIHETLRFVCRANVTSKNQKPFFSSCVVTFWSQFFPQFSLSSIRFLFDFLPFFYLIRFHEALYFSSVVIVFSDFCLIFSVFQSIQGAKSLDQLRRYFAGHKLHHEYYYTCTDIPFEITKYRFIKSYCNYNILISLQHFHLVFS